MKPQEQQLIEEILKEFDEHPCLKFANDAITLQAVRSGTSGYTGEENLSQWLEKKLHSLLDYILLEVEGLKLQGHEIGYNPDEIPPIEVIVEANKFLDERQKTYNKAIDDVVEIIKNLK